MNGNRLEDVVKDLHVPATARQGINATYQFAPRQQLYGDATFCRNNSCDCDRDDGCSPDCSPDYGTTPCPRHYDTPCVCGTDIPGPVTDTCPTNECNCHGN
jgi:hypothetical protein